MVLAFELFGLVLAHAYKKIKGAMFLINAHHFLNPTGGIRDLTPYLHHQPEPRVGKTTWRKKRQERRKKKIKSDDYWLVM